MRWSVVLCAIGLALLGCAEPEQVQIPDRLNQMIPLIEQGLPVLGVATRLTRLVDEVEVEAREQAKHHPRWRRSRI